MIKIFIVFFILHNVSGGMKNILILGGDGMMGSATTTMLMNAKGKFNLTLVNRGNWYWDTEETIKPFVNSYQCTRGDGFRETCTQLDDGLIYEAIIDFSCYHPLDMEDILIVFRGRFKKYIYISSDSVYEVSKAKEHGGFSLETDAVRPDDQNLQEELNKRDSYGHRKLQGEETLRKYHKLLKFDFISLRLPDVLGPRDNTNRFWKCFLWAKLRKIAGDVTIPVGIQAKPLSFVYSLDVARLIFSIVNDELGADILNDAYNLAFKEQISLKSLFQMMVKFNNESDGIEIKDDIFEIGFPSVIRGPVDITKAETVLKWAPTEINTALTETMKFYDDAQFNPEYKYILERILDFHGIKRDKYREFVLMHHMEAQRRKGRDEL